MEAIGLMAGGVAHDLNNILSGIVGYPELMLLKLSRESEMRKPLEAIQDSGERAAAVVADLLTVARGVASAKSVASLNSLLGEYFDSPEYDHLCSLHPSLNCHKELGENLPNISCSPVHIKKCIMNLMTNSAESLDQSGTITIFTSSIIPDQQWCQKYGLKQMEYVVLTIKDTGTGIPKDSIGHIFEPFYSKKVLGRSGTGLGLTVVWNTLKEHKGTVTVNSNDQGTSFKLFFPVTKEAISSPESATTDPLQGNGETILVIDDESTLRDIASSMLDVLGYTVTIASSGEEAVVYLQNHQVDLILLDMLMESGINGRETYEQIIKLHPGQKAIIASGFSESEDIKATLQLGADSFIKKPYSMDQLGRAVKEALISI
jgi:CheY-like chemotaxis protein